MSPIAVQRGAFRRDAVALIATTALCIALAATGTFARWHGAILLAGLALFLWRAFRGVGTGAAVVPETETAPRLSPLAAFGLFAAGLALLLVGARALVSGAVEIAGALGVSEAVIGVTVVAVGTSLPELVTSVTAARRGESDVAFGNVVGSNIFNILGILGATALIAPLPVPPETMALDVWAMAAATLLLVAAAVTGKGVSRGEGAALVALYAGYVTLLLV
jgi:cation:H+ antiporter